MTNLQKYFKRSENFKSLTKPFETVEKLEKLFTTYKMFLRLYELP